MPDSKLTSLTENTIPVSTDLLYLVDDPAGSALSQKITVLNLMNVGVSLLTLPVAVTRATTGVGFSLHAPNAAGANMQGGYIESKDYGGGVPNNNIVFGAFTTGAPNIRVQTDNVLAHVGINVGNTSTSAFAFQRLSNGSTYEPSIQLRSADMQGDGTGPFTDFYQNNDVFEWKDIDGRRARMLPVASGGLTLDGPTGTASWSAFGVIGSGDGFARIAMGLDTGAPFLGWGPGSGARDVFFRRLSSGDLAIETGSTQRMRIPTGKPMIILDEADTDATTTDCDANDSVAIYTKNNKIVFAYNNGGTMTYLSLALSGSGVTWVHSTTAP